MVVESKLRMDLLVRRRELRTRLQAIYDDYQKGLPADSEEQATELENADVLAEIARITQEELVKIEKRLRELSI